MQIDRQLLVDHITRMSQQVAAFQGAIEFAQMLLAKLDEPDPQIDPQMPTMTVSQLQEAIERGKEHA